MKKIMSILEAIDAKAQEFDAKHWQSWLRYADRYFRKGRHHDAPDTVSGYAMRAWLKANLDHWEDVRSRYGIEAAINLGY